MSRQPLKENPGPATKKAKAESQVLTFKLSHSPVLIEILDSHRVFDLVDIVCRETSVGMDEDVYDHMWDVTVPGKGIYNSSDEYVDHSEAYGYSDEKLLKASQTKLGDLNLTLNTPIELKYDYGSTSYYTFTLVDQSKTTEASRAFPRRKAVELRAGFTEFQTEQVNLNTKFPELNQWIRGAPNRLRINLFQPGKKHNWGFLDCEDHHGCRTMMYMPAKPTGLSDYLHTLNYASGFKGNEQYSWFSMVVLPSNANGNIYRKYQQRTQKGFCEAAMAFRYKFKEVDQAFPKLAAFSGLGATINGIPKGWLTYQNKTLRLCTGAPETVKNKAPKGTAWDGVDQHNPQEGSGVLCEMQVNIQSLHHLFCTAEGLLGSL